MNMKIAVLITCFNRKEKTIHCLNCLKTELDKHAILFDIHLTDDGCTDGTADTVLKHFPSAQIYKGKDLYWAGGMRLAWRGAISKGGYDYYMLLNDDTFPNKYLIPDFLDCIKFAGEPAIICANTCDPKTNLPTYVGVKCINRFTLKSKKTLPEGIPYYIDYIGANLWFVPSVVVEKIGIFPEIYIHGVADNDYCWRAKEAGFKLIGTPHYCAYCEADHKPLNKLEFKSMGIKQRWTYLNSPKGVEIKQQLYFQRRFFPWRYPFVIIKTISKLLLG